MTTTDMRGVHTPDTLTSVTIYITHEPRTGPFSATWRATVPGRGAAEFNVWRAIASAIRQWDQAGRPAGAGFGSTQAPPVNAIGTVAAEQRAVWSAHWATLRAQQARACAKLAAKHFGRPARIGALALFVALFAACAGSDTTVAQAECEIPTRAYCDAQAACHSPAFNLRTCYDNGAAACAASAYVRGTSDADPWRCGELQQELTCAPIGGTLNNSESASCLRSFWDFGGSQ